MNLENLKALIDKEIGALEFKPEPDNLYRPLEYILSLGGKRIRPLLVLLGYALYKNDPEKIIGPALSVEVFHNFTLMHDDIMDKAPIRRGKPTVHEKWNETIAILSGDTMLVKAYQQFEGLTPALLPSAFSLFNKCAIEVCEGQQMDMDFEEREEVSEGEYLEMIRLKTAVLLGYSLRLGGLLAGKDEKLQQQLDDLGVAMGMAFQLMDDHLDTFGDESFGKQIGGDILANKKTFLLINALKNESSKNAIRQWLASSSQGEDKIEAVTKIYREGGIEELSKNKIKEYGETAALILDEIEGNDKVKAMLSGYIEKLNKRVQ